MPNFTSIEAALTYAKKQIANAMQDDVARHVEGLVQKYLLSTVYANPQEEYERTYEVLRALTIDKVVVNGDEISIRIYIDADKITPRSNEGMWGSHQSMDGTPFNEELPFVLEYGNKKFNPYYNTPAFGFMQLTEDELKSTKMHLQKLIGYLKTKGIQVVK